MRRGAPVILLLLSVVAAANLLAAPRVDGAAPERILVTIRYDARGALHGDAVERYRRPRAYGAGANAAPILDALAREYGIARVSGWPMRSLAVHCEVYALAPGTDATA